MPQPVEALHIAFGPVLFRTFTVDPGGWMLWIGGARISRFGDRYAGKGDAYRWSVQWRERIYRFGTVR